MKNAQVPGASRPFGHDYQPELTRFISEMFDLPAGEDQLVSIEAALAKRESVREQIFKD